MGTMVNIHEAKTHLSKLIERAENGEEIVIARAGKPVVHLALVTPAKKKKRLGFLAGQDFRIPENFNEVGREEIKKMFYGDK